VCTNNLRQFGLSIHEYHDVHSELPPLATDDRHWSWIALITPYLELQEFYNSLELWQPADTAENLKLVRKLRMSTFVCPTRRSSRDARNDGVFRGTQPCDYVGVSTTQGTTWGPDTDGVLVFRKEPPTKDRKVPRSATTFQSITDGSAFTLMIGEKHMRPNWLRGPLDDSGLVAFASQHTIRVAGDGKVMRGLAQDVEDPDDWKFGSGHPEVVLFANADASVRIVRKKTDPKVLKEVMSRNDGLPAQVAQ
jgi:hypothetical protein